MPARPGLTAAAPALAGVPATLLGVLPAWCVVGLVVLSALLAAGHVTVTQIIRLIAAARITGSGDALRALQIQDQPPRPRCLPSATQRAPSA